jgi:7 transmembrane sweet-taste receptor of 3 GCPR
VSVLVCVGNKCFVPVFSPSPLNYTKAYMNPTLEFINVSMRDIFATAALLLTPNVIVLLTWTLLAPLEWTRVQQSTMDIFGRHTESFGECASEDAYIYAIVICAINFTFLMLGNWAVYQSRNIETEYNESRYIAVSLFAVLQAWCMGIPILAVTYDNPQGRFYVMCGIIFVTAQSILSLVYIPKMLNLRQARKVAQKEEDPKRKAYAAYANRRAGIPANHVAQEEEEEQSEIPSCGDEVHDMSSSNPVSSTAARPGLTSGTPSRRSMGMGPRSASTSTGIKVIHNPKVCCHYPLL